MAGRADYRTGCTDWDVPKHQGVTMFLVPIEHPGITLRRITQLNWRVPGE
jgi:alkylation response protein AidB-like acyl-CoA dehydrogenase